MPDRYRQLVAIGRQKVESIDKIEEQKNALDDRLGLQKLEVGRFAIEAETLGHLITEYASDINLRLDRLEEWSDTCRIWPEKKIPKDVIVSYSVLKELDSDDRFAEMAELVKKAKARAKDSGKSARIIVNDIRELRGKKLTRYAPPPRTADEKVAEMQKWMNEPEVASRAANDIDTRMAFNRALGDRHVELVKHAKSNERSNWNMLSDADTAWDAHNNLEKATAFAQQAYNQYADLGQLSDAERARARALLSRLTLVASYLESLIEGGQPFDVALADLLDGGEG